MVRFFKRPLCSKNFRDDDGQNGLQEIVQIYAHLYSNQLIDQIVPW